MRGRKAELRVIEGGLSTTPPPPDWLPEEGQEEWNRVVPDLVARGVLSDADLSTVESYCLIHAQIRAAQASLAEQGQVIESSTGAKKRNPAAQTLFQALAEKRRLAAELGLTPASRNKAGAGPSREAGHRDLFDLGL